VSAQHPSRLQLDRLALGVADDATKAHASSCAQCGAHLDALKVLTGAPDFVHPSRLALDRMALGLSDDTARAHAQSCAACSAHVSAVAVELPIPGWVRELEGARPTAWWRPVFGAVAVVAAALIAFVAIPPQAQVWVNRGGAVSLWDGAPLKPDDAFRFEVKPGGFTHLTVVELEGGKLYRVLHSAPIGGEGLSPAWAVDAEGAQEEVVLLMSKAPLSEEALRSALAGEGGVETWSTRWKFPKEVR
jgi:hypothetical protein